MNMAARRGRKGQFKKTSRRRTNKYKGAVNVPNAAVSLVTANALTQSMFGTNLRTFLLDGWMGDEGSRYQNFNNSWEMTLAEMLMKPTQGRSADYSMGDVIKHNLSTHGAQQAMAIVGTKLAVGAVKKLGVGRSANKLARSIGAGKMVKF